MNQSIIFLDLFGIDFSSDCLPELLITIETNKSLKWLRLAGTHMRFEYVN